MFDAVNRIIDGRGGKVLRVYMNRESAEAYGTVLWVRRALGRPVEYVVSPWFTLGASDHVDLGVSLYYPVMGDGTDAIPQHDEAVARFWNLTEGDRPSVPVRRP